MSSDLNGGKRAMAGGGEPREPSFASLRVDSTPFARGLRCQFLKRQAVSH